MLSQVASTFESLESRMLLSGSSDPGWVVDDDFQLVAGQGAGARSIVVDDVGNVFGADWADTPTGPHLLIREKPAGTTTWTTITDTAAYHECSGLYAYRDPATGVESLVVCTLPASPTAQWVVLKGPVGGDLEVVDALPAGSESLAFNIAGSGPDIYVTGYVHDSKGLDHLVVRRSRSGGDSGTWEQVLDFQHITRSTDKRGNTITVADPSQGRCIALAPSGVYVGGQYGSSAHWLTMASTSGDPGTWQVVDDYQLDPIGNGACSPACIGADSSGNIFLAGQGFTVSGKAPKTTSTGYWLTRRGTVSTGPSGITVKWDNVDKYRLPDSPANANNWPGAFATDTQGNKYVVGTMQSNTGYRWIVRSSSTGDLNTWNTIDDWQAYPGRTSKAQGIAIDGSNNIYVSGTVVDSAGVSHWIVKELPAAGSTSATQAPAAATAGPARKASPFSTRSILLKKRAAVRVHARQASVR